MSSLEENSHPLSENKIGSVARADRRHPQKGKTLEEREAFGAAVRLRNLHLEINEVIKVRNQERVDQGTLTKVIYRDRPYIDKYLSKTRLLPSYLANYYRSSLGKKGLYEGAEKLEAYDLFNRKVGGNFLLEGTSLADIEQMPPDLSPENLARINRMYYTGSILNRFNRNNPLHGEVRESMIELATQKFARPEENLITPKELQPLERRLIAHLDYYTDLMTDTSLSGYELDNFVKGLSFTSPWLLMGLGAYIPARLGLTPSSAVKLYNLKGMILPEEIKLLPGGMVRQSWSKLTKNLVLSSEGAVRAGGIPADLEKYQHFNSETDKEAETILSNYYSLKSPKETDSFEQLSQSLNRLDLYKPVVYRSVMRARDRHNIADRINLSVPDFIAPHIIITSQYPQTMMLILQFNDRAHLTLDIGKDNKVFGLPAKLAYENPHIAERLFLDIMPSLLDVLKTDYPNVEKDDKVIKERATIEVKPKESSFISPTAKKPAYIPTIKERYYRIPKRVLTPLARFLAGPKPFPKREEEERQYFVLHTRSELVSYLGRRVPEKIIDRTMKDIRDFEYGRGDFKKLTHLNFWEVVSGDFRIILRPGSGNILSIEDLVNRKDLDKRLKTLSI